MSIKAINMRTTGATTPIENYDSSKFNLGSLIKQYNGGGLESFIGPAKIGMARPMEQSVAISCAYPYVVRFSDTIDHVYLAENSAAAATRRIVLYEYNKLTSEFNWKGFITLTYPTATTHTIRGFRMVRDLYTVGTVGVSGSTVTGVDTGWKNDRMSVGCRIGFGSTKANDIVDWYEIGSIASNTSITLTTPISSTISAGTPYVIEDIMIVTTNINTAPTNGGLFITKGIRPELFTPSGTVIPSATTLDNIRAVYWLADAGTVTNIASIGSGIQDKTSWIDQSVYIINANTTTTASIFVYNFRKALTLAGGKDTTTLKIKTGVTTALTGILSTANNGRVITTQHGPGNGIESLYFVTASRVYRSAISDITNGSTLFISDNMVEMPPGGLATYLATGALSSIEYAETLDRLIVITSGTLGNRSYVTKYNTTSSPFDHIFLNDDKQLDQSSADSGGVPHPSILASIFSIWSDNGILYLCRIGTSLTTNQIYSLPIAAHQTYAVGNNQMLITPKFMIPDANKLYAISVGSVNKLGSDTFSLPTEPYKVHYRTNGIDDNTGNWTLLEDLCDISGVSATEIQFMVIFKILGTTCIPARILGFSLTYEDNNTDSHYEASLANSSITNRTFSFRQNSEWNTNIPNMRVQLYNAQTNSLILDDTTLLSTYGVFEHSIDNGTSWLPWDSMANAIGNYIRYTASSLPNGVRVRVLLKQN